MSRPQLIFTCEHASNSLPPNFKGRIPERLLHSHAGYDLGAVTLAKKLARAFNAPLLSGEVSRLIVDLNRSSHHRGVISHYVAASSEERLHLLTKYHAPFRAQTLALIRAMLNKGRPVLHISVHSFTRKLSGIRRTADIGLLYDPSRKLEKDTALRWQSNLQAKGQLVRRNYPYRGTSDGHTTALRKVFGPTQYRGIELEVCNDKLCKGENVQELHRTIVASLSLTLQK